MPALADNPEIAEDLASAAKRFFQPPKEPVEVKHPEPTPPAETAKPVAKQPPAQKQAAKAPEPQKDAKPPDAASKDEAEVVFGTPPPSKAKVEPPKVSDDEFEAKLKEETKGMTDKAGAKWEQLRRSEKAAKDEARQAKEEAAAAREAAKEREGSDDAPKSAALNDRIKALEEQLAEAEKDLAVTKVERTQKYRREVAGPLSELDKAAEDLATRYEVDAKAIKAALETQDAKERNAALAELAADFNEGDRIDLYTIAKDMDRLRKAGEKLRERAKSDLSALEQEEKEVEERTTSEQRKVFSTAAERAWDEAAKKLKFLNHFDKAPEWNAALDASRKQSAEYAFGSDPATDGKIAAEAKQLGFVLKALEAKEKDNAALTAERDALLERIKTDGELDPDLGGAGVDGSGDEDDGGDDLTLGERAKRKFGNRA